MGRVMNYLTPITETAIPAADDRLICDDVEMLLDTMIVIQRDPKAVAWRLRTLACCVCLIYMVLQRRWDLPTAASKQPKSQQI